MNESDDDRLRMAGWAWSDPRWKERVGSSIGATLQEALRRAVDIRDGDGAMCGHQAVMLVGVLNHLQELLAGQEA